MENNATWITSSFLLSVQNNISGVAAIVDELFSKRQHHIKFKEQTIKADNEKHAFLFLLIAVNLFSSSVYRPIFV